jgi:hypothetical protein
MAQRLQALSAQWREKVSSLRWGDQPLLSRAVLWSDTAVLVWLGLLDVVIHLIVASNYGYFRDELYYLISGRHPAFGYVDFPLLIGWLGGIMHVLFHDNLFAIHIIPALAGGCLVVVGGLIARELGGGRVAQVFASLGVLVVPDYLATASIFSMDVLDQLWWALAALMFVRIVRRDRPQDWRLFGLFAGLGLLTKLTMLFFGFALVVGVLLMPRRRDFLTPWPWIGGAIAFAFLLPYIIWNAVNGWPTVEFWRHYGGLSGGGPLGFLENQLISINLFLLPLVIAGLVWYFGNNGKPFRALGWSFVVLYVLFTLINAKAYFLAPSYTFLIAGGVCQFERFVQKQGRQWAVPAYAAVMAISGALFVPLAMPFLPPQAFVQSYAHVANLGNGAAGQGNSGAFPQYLGDRFGWPTLASTVASVYQGLPPAERSQACIFTANYGEASALALYQQRYHLPPVISGHNNFYLWGPGSCNGNVVITVGLEPSDDTKSYASVTQVTMLNCTYCTPAEYGAPIVVAMHPLHSLKDLWQSVKHFD